MVYFSVRQNVLICEVYLNKLDSQFIQVSSENSNANPEKRPIHIENTKRSVSLDLFIAIIANHEASLLNLIF